MTIPMVRQRKQPAVPRLPWLSLFCLLVCAGWPAAALANNILTNASAVLALSADQATSNIPVSVTGVVTAAEPNWLGRFFVQDASGGVFVDYRLMPHPEPGDIVRVSG